MQFTRYAALALVAATIVPSLAAAQDVRQKVRIERREAGAPRAFSMTLPRRQRLGVAVDLQKQDDDKYGATIDAVTPGGPAAKAGLRAGDVITALDGKSLTSGPTPADADAESSAPGLRLIELASKLKPNDTITVAYRRNGEAKTVTLVTGEDGGDMVFMRGPGGPGGDVRRFEFRMPGPGGDLPPELRGLSPERIEDIEIIRDGEGGPGRRIMIGMRGPLGDLELAPLNADLGRYFGASEGVLVLNTPKAEGLGLKGGDVVTAVDGRKVSGPSQLLRILRSYDPGDAMKFEVLRDRKKETVNAKLPEPKKMSWKTMEDGGL